MCALRPEIYESVFVLAGGWAHKCMNAQRVCMHGCYVRQDLVPNENTGLCCFATCPAFGLCPVCQHLPAFSGKTQDMQVASRCVHDVHSKRPATWLSERLSSLAISSGWPGERGALAVPPGGIAVAVGTVSLWLVAAVAASVVMLGHVWWTRLRRVVPAV